MITLSKQTFTSVTTFSIAIENLYKPSHVIHNVFVAPTPFKTVEIQD